MLASGLMNNNNATVCNLLKRKILDVDTKKTAKFPCFFPSFFFNLVNTRAVNHRKSSEVPTYKWSRTGLFRFFTGTFLENKFVESPCDLMRPQRKVLSAATSNFYGVKLGAPVTTTKWTYIEKGIKCFVCAQHETLSIRGSEVEAVQTLFSL